MSDDFGGFRDRSGGNGGRRSYSSGRDQDSFSSFMGEDMNASSSKKRQGGGKKARDPLNLDDFFNDDFGDSW